MVNKSDKTSERKILLHACCAVCSGYPLKRLKEAGYEVVVLFYNPNVSPAEEYERRKAELVRLCKIENVELVIADDVEEVFLTAVKGVETEPERGKRCDKCFELRLDKTAQTAFNMGIDKFSTTLSASPHKNYEMIKTAGEKASCKFGVEFIGIDFKKQNGFKITNEIANGHGFYRQSYCGCRFSFR